jgi:tol-pal system protein YbgF
MTMKPTFKSSIAAAFMAAFSLAPLCAHASLLEDDEARKAILDLRNRVEALSRDINSRIDNKADKTGALDLNSQNEQLRQEIAKLRGQVEVLTNELANAQQRQKDFYVDLDNRLRKLEPQKTTIDGKDATIQPGEQSAYDAALALFKAGDYRGASSAFVDFLRRFPQSGYAASAQYWLGNTYYAQRDYRNAINAQQTVTKNYPDSPKVPDALLNIASCYIELKDKASAKKTLQNLIANYGDSQAALAAKERLATLK